MAEPKIKASISLRRDQFAALRERAEAERHGNVSRIVQRAVDRELDRVADRESDATSDPVVTLQSATVAA